jgi:hypothetical protein
VKVEFVSAATAAARSRDSQQEIVAVPVAPVQTGANSFAGILAGAIGLGILIAAACLFGTSIHSSTSNQTLTLPPPTPNESAQQELILADLGKGTPPSHFKLTAF